MRVRMCLDIRGKVDQGMKEVGDHQSAQRGLQEINATQQESETEMQSMPEELEKRGKELARSTAELEQFAYVASHDLQEPLRAVTSFAQLLAKRYQGKLDKEADDFIHYILEGTIRMQALINELLVYSRVNTRGQPLKPTDSESALKTALASLHTTIKENAAVVTYDNLPTVMADGPQLVQVFENLIANSIKFRNEKQPEVRVKAERKGDTWQFTVQDNGIGIDPQYHDRIFVIFQRLNGKEKYPGTGAGLAICKKVVERHGGEIWMKSELKKGATFYFTLPSFHSGRKA